MTCAECDTGKLLKFPGPSKTLFATLCLANMGLVEQRERAPAVKFVSKIWTRPGKYLELVVRSWANIPERSTTIKPMSFLTCRYQLRWCKEQRFVKLQAD